MRFCTTGLSPHSSCFASTHPVKGSFGQASVEGLGVIPCQQQPRMPAHAGQTSQDVCQTRRQSTRGEARASASKRWGGHAAYERQGAWRPDVKLHARPQCTARTAYDRQASAVRCRPQRQTARPRWHCLKETSAHARVRRGTDAGERGNSRTPDNRQPNS